MAKRARPDAAEINVEVDGCDAPLVTRFGNGVLPWQNVLGSLATGCGHRCRSTLVAVVPLRRLRPRSRIPDQQCRQDGGHQVSSDSMSECLPLGEVRMQEFDANLASYGQQIRTTLKSKESAG